jgi:hypothetical protein
VRVAVMERAHVDHDHLALDLEQTLNTWLKLAPANSSSIGLAM